MSLFGAIVSDVGKREKLRKKKLRERKVKRRTDPWKRKYKREISPGVTEYPVYKPPKKGRRRQ